MRTWLVGLPVGGTALTAGLGVLIPGVGPLVLGAAGLVAGSCLSVALVYLSADDEPSETAPSTSAATTAPSTAPLRVAVVDAVTGTAIDEPVTVEAEQSVVGEQHEITVEGGERTLDLRTLRWGIAAAYDGQRASAEVAVGETDRVELAIPPSRLTVDVRDRAGDPLPDASVVCETDEGPEAAGTAEPTSAADATHAVPVSASASRVTVTVDHDSFEPERTDAVIDGSGEHRVSVALERPAAEADSVEPPAGEADATAVDPGADSVPPASGGGGLGEPDSSATLSQRRADEVSSPSTGTPGSEEPAGEGPIDGSDADRTPETVEIEGVGATGIDRHIPPHSPNPPRIALEPSVVADADDVLASDRFTVVRRVAVGGRVAAVTVPTDSRDGRATVAATAERADEWRDIDHHPHVAKLLDARADDQPHLAVEYCDRTLADVETAFEQRGAVWMATCLADAVATAHRAGVYHLNLTPGNVLLQDVAGGRWPVAKLTDWDLPRFTDFPSEVFRPVPDAYAAPEQLDSDATVDERTDVYQLGVIAHQLLVGDPPMGGAHVTDRSPEHARPIPSIVGTNADLDDGLDEVLRRATAVRPEDRYGTVDDLRDDLTAVATRVADFY